jgi:hypothetical protein
LKSLTIYSLSAYIFKSHHTVGFITSAAQPYTFSVEILNNSFLLNTELTEGIQDFYNIAHLSILAYKYTGYPESLRICTRKNLLGQAHIP